MKRSSFFKSLVTFVVAPKIISEIDWGKKRRLPVNEDACVTSIEFQNRTGMTPEDVLRWYNSTGYVYYKIN